MMLVAGLAFGLPAGFLVLRMLRRESPAEAAGDPRTVEMFNVRLHPVTMDEALARAALLGGLLLLFRALGRPDTPRAWLPWSVLAGLAWGVMGLSVPFYIAVVYAVLGAWGLALWRRAAALSSAASAEDTVARLRQHLADDLDTPKALAALDAWATFAVERGGADTGAPGLFADAVDALLGVPLR